MNDAQKHTCSGVETPARIKRLPAFLQVSAVVRKCAEVVTHCDVTDLALRRVAENPVEVEVN